MVNQHRNSYHGQSVKISETLILKSLKSTRQLVFKSDSPHPRCTSAGMWRNRRESVPRNREQRTKGLSPGGPLELKG